MRRRRLGQTELLVSPLGLGCWQFSEGSGVVGAYWPKLSGDDMAAIVRRSLEGGIDWFDTAEAYGWGKSEEALSAALQAAGKKPGEVVVATKWNPFGRFASNLRSTIDERLRRLAPFPVDLHQVHQPYSFSSIEAQMDALADLVEQGKIRAVGVSNFNEGQLRRAHARLKARGVPLASNQVQYSLVDRRIERNGVLQAARELGVSIIAYSPLAQGLLSGKFHDDPTLVGRAGMRRVRPEFWAGGLARLRPLVELLKAVGAAHRATPSQVALAWLLQAHGDTVLPIPGATKLKHADENVGAMGLELTPRELEEIGAAAAR